MKTKNIILLVSFHFLANVSLAQQASGTAQSHSQLPASESEAKTPFLFKGCAEEQKKYCPQGSLRDLSACLIQHNSELSNGCKQDLERFVEMRREATTRGGGALGAFGGLNAFGPPIPLISYDTRYNPGVNSPYLAENRVGISAPIYHAGTDTTTLSLMGSDLHLGAPVGLSSGISVPSDLNRVELGGQFFRQLPEDRYWGLRASFGYAGDQPFQNPAEATFSLNVNYGMPAANHEKGFYVFSIFISNNGLLGNYIPIPGLSYLYKGDSVTGLFGFPVTSIQWTPVFPWAFSMAIFGPTLQTEAAYGDIQHGQFFAGYYWTRQSYILAQFTDSKERLTLQEMRWAFGARTAIFKALLLEAQLGKSFARALFAGNSLFDDSGGLANLSDDWYGSLGLRLRF